MITPENRIKQEDYANLTDYSLKRPEGAKQFYAFVTFTDMSTCMWDYIFTRDRFCAHMLVLEKFHDCLNYIHSISLHEA